MSSMDRARGSRAVASSTLFLPVTADLYARLEALVAAGIELLDAIDGDPDLEPSIGSDQPWLSEDGEEDDCDLEVGSDDEPSLGWTSGEAALGFDPLSGMDVDREIDADHEPSLGAPERADFTPIGTFSEVNGLRLRRACGTSQLHWGDATTDDGESDDDNGLADEDGAVEQFTGLLVTGRGFG